MLSSAPGADSRSCPCVTDPPALVHRPPCPPTTRAPLQVLTGAVSPRRASSRSSSTVSVHSGRLAARCIAGCPALHPSEARSSWPDPVWPPPPPRALTGPHSPETHPPSNPCGKHLHPHFINEGTESQRHEVFCRGYTEPSPLERCGIPDTALALLAGACPPHC